ncbi:MAG: alpha/beta hydrolase [Cyanomargarita calcarea GSE-NOS-MK-12-04C]|jgi:pimeloyl-ACP methyl ester carboxylesterase|uniref:Alpha/beta hydrolase n=1 Tax=Cyanomargarita calcarea GSE-NOS-MK-12-04C TaxID=2839659 RepID=A0A951URX4_9CYAN|nr:alpha/beta hydrolase [Cyanomargarita calcarea GSE-NOS-MK-12-04C]
MTTPPDTLWLTPNPELKCLNHSLLCHLSRKTSIGQWEYQQTPDEPNSLDVAVVLLHDYLKVHHRQINLIGHSTGGLLGLMYARKHPERVKSLTLLSVGVNPGIDWQAHYYVQRKLLPCNRGFLLYNMANSLFGNQDELTIRKLVNLLEKDLDNSASPHSLLQQAVILPIQVSVPLLVCGSKDDMVVDSHQIQSWRNFIKPNSSLFRLWECPRGKHFFHHFYPEMVAEEIVKFWDAVKDSSACNSLSYVKGDGQSPLKATNHMTISER